VLLPCVCATSFEVSKHMFAVFLDSLAQFSASLSQGALVRSTVSDKNIRSIAMVYPLKGSSALKVTKNHPLLGHAPILGLVPRNGATLRLSFEPRADISQLLTEHDFALGARPSKSPPQTTQDLINFVA